MSDPYFCIIKKLMNLFWYCMLFYDCNWIITNQSNLLLAERYLLYLLLVKFYVFLLVFSNQTTFELYIERCMLVISL